jgi:hypothetical protein
MLEPITSDDGCPLEGSSPTSTDAHITLDIKEEEDGGESNDSDVDIDDYDMEDHLQS